MIRTDEEFLRQESNEVSLQEIQEMGLLDILKEELGKTDGVGLAAVQIGMHLRCAWYHVPGDEQGRALVNPVIISEWGLFPIWQCAIGKEGCLSMPNKRFDTYRFNHLIIEETTNKGRERRHVTEFEAVIVQHETDHMNGVLCCDRVVRQDEPGRNDLCPCNSGKKFKKCCLV